MLSQIKIGLSEKLKDKGYRARFFRGQAEDEIAFQLRQARRKRQKTQPELGVLTGMKQSAISRIEQASYSRWTFRTLLRIAEALDLRVRINLDYAEDVIREYEAMERQQESTAQIIAKSVESRIFEYRGESLIPAVAEESTVTPQVQ